MTRLNLFAALLIGLLVGASCTPSPDENYSYIWSDFGALAGNAEGNAIVALNSNILVGTDNGVQVYTAPSQGEAGTWQQTNLQGVKIVAFYVHPFLTNVVLAFGDPNAATNTAENPVPVYRSTNSGSSWSSASTGLLDEEAGLYPPVTSVTDKFVQPVSGAAYTADIYVSLGDDAIARSRDSGLTWSVVHGDGTLNPDIACKIIVRQTFYTYLFQGCTTTTGDTYIERFDLNADEYTSLSAPTRFFDASVLGNKRVVGFERSLFSDTIFYVLLDGGLGAVGGDEYRWVYQYPQNQGANTTMSFLWVNPQNQNNLVFGGYEEGNSTTFGMYDTPNHGRNVSMIDPPSALGLTAPQIMDAYIAGNVGQDLLILIRGTNGGGQQVTKVMSRSQVLPD